MNKQVCLLCVMWGIAWTQPASGGMFLVSSSEDVILTAPRTTYSESSDCYLVVWQAAHPDWEATGLEERYSDIHYRLIDSQGQPLG